MCKYEERYFQVFIDFCFSLWQQSKKLWRLITKVPLWHLCQLQIFASFEIPPLAFACNRVAGQQKIFLVQKKIGFLNFFLQTFRASKNLSCWLDFFWKLSEFQKLWGPSCRFQARCQKQVSSANCAPLTLLHFFSLSFCRQLMERIWRCAKSAQEIGQLLSKGCHKPCGPVKNNDIWWFRARYRTGLPIQLKSGV